MTGKTSENGRKMPEISAAEYLNSLLLSYQNAEKHFTQAVADVIAAEIRRDEAKTEKDEAFQRLEEAREQYSLQSSRKSQGGGTTSSFNKETPGKRHSVKKSGAPSPSDSAPPMSPVPVTPGSKKAPKIFSRASSIRRSLLAVSAPPMSPVPMSPVPMSPVLMSPVPGSKKAPKIFSRAESIRRSLAASKTAGPFEPLDSATNVLEICTGRTREWFDNRLDCESLGLVKKFYKASFGTKTHEKTQKVSIFTVVLNDDWNDLVSKTSEVQEMYIGQNMDPNGKTTMRDRAAEALVAPPQKEPVALFFAPKNSKGTSNIYYGGHWRVADGKILKPPRSVKGQLRQCLAKFEFVGVDKAIVEAINRD